MNLTLCGGNETTSSITATADADRGDVIEIGNLPCVAKDTHKTGDVIAVGVHGGIYRGPINVAEGTNDRTGQRVFIDASGFHATAGKHFGVVIAHDDTEAVVLHCPDGTSA